MSNRPVDALLEGAAASESWSEHVEAHLDANPLPVDEAAVQAAAARLERRLSRRPSGRRHQWWVVAGVAAVAATALLVVRPTLVGVAVDEAPAGVMIHRAQTSDGRIEVDTVPARIEWERVGRVATPASSTTVLSSEVDGAAVVLVQEGALMVDGQPVEAGHWVILAPEGDDAPGDVVFPDGEAPPPLHPDQWPSAEVDAALQEVRWRSLPTRTTETLERLLEEAP